MPKNRSALIAPQPTLAIAHLRQITRHSAKEFLHYTQHLELMLSRGRVGL